MHPEHAPYIKPTFWQQEFVQSILPMIIAILLHAGIIAIAIVLGRVVEVVRGGQVREQIIVAEAEMVQAGPEGGIPHPGLGDDPTRDAKQDRFPDVPQDSKGIAEKQAANLQVSLMGAAGDTDGAATIGIGPGSTIGKAGGNLMGGGDGDGSGNLAPFGIPGGGGGIGPKSSFVGLGGNAKRIVYVCDASGTMLSIFDNLRSQLSQSVGDLKVIQAFNVIFFQDDDAAMFDKSLVPATAQAKQKLNEWVQTKIARGHTNPIPAIRAAFAQKPQLMYVLTDGFDAVESLEAVVEEFRKLNKDKSVKVNTLLVGSQENQELVDALKKIASENGGRFKQVAKDGL